MHVYLFVYIYLITFGSIIHVVLAFISVIDQGIFPLDKGTVGVQFFIDVENEHHMSACNVNSWSKTCCLSDDNNQACSIDAINNENMELVKPKERETFIFVYPTLYPYDQVGYCDFLLDFKCGNQNHFKRLDARIPFNTKLSNKKQSQFLQAYSDVKGDNCESLDQDPLHGCEPVNCDLKYSGRRPYFEGSSSKCVNAPVCETDLTKELPDIVYVPNGNICRDLDRPLTIGDIYAISTGLGIVTESTKSNMNDLKVLLKSNCSTISQNLRLLRDMMYGKLCPIFNGDTSEYKDCCTKAILSICACIMASCGLLLSIVCFIHTMVWCYGKWSRGELKSIIKKLKSGLNKKKMSTEKPSNINRELTDNLLREVIVRDLPIEMRDSVVDICHRINHEIKEKKRYRMKDLGSQVHLREGECSSSSETSSHTSVPYDDDNVNLMK